MVSDQNLKLRTLCDLQKMDMKTKMDTGEPVTMVDVYQEFNDHIAEKHKITKFKSKVMHRI